jgi:hypothetical protein
MLKVTITPDHIAAAIAAELGKSVYAVRFVMWVIKDVWGYESSLSRNEGYRRI